MNSPTPTGGDRSSGFGFIAMIAGAMFSLVAVIHWSRRPPTPPSTPPPGSRTSTTKLKVPDNIRALPGNPGTIVLQWIQGTAKYRVWRGVVPDTSQASRLGNAPFEGARFVDSDPLPGQSWYWVQEILGSNDGPLGPAVEAWNMGDLQDAQLATRDLYGTLQIVLSAPANRFPKDAVVEWWLNADEVHPREAGRVGPAIGHLTVSNAITRRGNQPVTVKLRPASTNWGKAAAVSLVVLPIPVPTVSKRIAPIEGKLILADAGIESATHLELRTRTGTSGPAEAVAMAVALRAATASRRRRPPPSGRTGS